MELERDYRTAHGHSPSRPVQLGQAQQATLATREGKKLPKTLGDQLTGWSQRAAGVLGPQAAQRLVPNAVGRRPTFTDPAGVNVGPVARTALRAVSTERSTGPGGTRWPRSSGSSAPSGSPAQ